jgi:hypothetical protein
VSLAASRGGDRSAEAASWIVLAGGDGGRHRLAHSGKRAYLLVRVESLLGRGLSHECPPP